MAQSGFTPIQLYRTTTASAVPTAGNLADGELAINTNDGRLFYKDNGGAVQTIAWRIVPISAGGTGATTASGALTNLGAVAKAGDTMTGPLVVDANSSSAAVRITQTGAGNALVVEDSANPDATPFVVDQFGSVFVGSQTGLTTLFATPPRLSVAQQNFPMAVGNYANDGFGARVDLIKSRSTTINGQTIVQNGDDLGYVYFGGSDGTGVIPAALIMAEVDGTPGTNDMPGRLVFSTTADGASSPTERMRITAAGNVGVGDTNPTPVYGYTNVISVSSNYPGVQFNSAASSTLQKFQIGLGVNSFQFYDGSAAAERMRIDASGNVGIGTSLPRSRLNVVGATGAPSLVSDTNNIALTTSAISVELAEGAYSSSPFSYWMQTKQTTNSGAHFPLVLNPIEGNVGIGTSAPAAKFAVSTGDNRKQFVVDTSGDPVVRVGVPDWYNIGALAFVVGGGGSGTERMRIDAAGNVGIGTSSPTGRLSVTNGDDARVKIFSNGGSVGVIDAVANTNDATGRWLSINPTGGNVGIGTSSPGARLDVSGNIRLSAAGPNIEFNNGGAMVYGPAANTLAFATGGGPSAPVERFRVGPAGQLGIGGANYGTSGQVLTSNGAGSAPSWQSVGGTANGLLLNVQVFTSSGTYTRTAGATRAVVVAVGGGGGGAGTGGVGSTGGTTSFGSHVSAAGGGGGTFGAPGSGGTGGTGSLISIPGAPGQNVQTSGSSSGSGGGQGGARGVVASNNGIAGTRGGGGSGGSLSTICGDTSGSGGGQGETAIDYITSGLGATETVTIGGGGAGGTGSRPGGAGGAGYIIVYEYS